METIYRPTAPQGYVYHGYLFADWEVREKYPSWVLLLLANFIALIPLAIGIVLLWVPYQYYVHIGLPYAYLPTFELPFVGKIIVGGGIFLDSGKPSIRAAPVPLPTRHTHVFHSSCGLESVRAVRLESAAQWPDAAATLARPGSARDSTQTGPFANGSLRCVAAAGTRAGAAHRAAGRGAAGARSSRPSTAWCARSRYCARSSPSGRFQPQHHRCVAKDLMPVLKQLSAARRETILTLGRILEGKAAGGRPGSAVGHSLVHHLLELARAQLEDDPQDAQIIALHDQYADIGFAEDQELDRELARGMAAQMFGVELDNTSWCGRRGDGRRCGQGSGRLPRRRRKPRVPARRGESANACHGQGRGRREGREGSQPVRARGLSQARQRPASGPRRRRGRARMLLRADAARQRRLRRGLPGRRCSPCKLETNRSMPRTWRGCPLRVWATTTRCCAKQLRELEQELAGITGHFAGLTGQAPAVVTPAAVQHALKRELAELKRAVKALKAHHAMMQEPAQRKRWLSVTRAICATRSGWTGCSMPSCMCWMRSWTWTSIRSGAGERAAAGPQAPADSRAGTPRSSRARIGYHPAAPSQESAPHVRTPDAERRQAHRPGRAAGRPAAADGLIDAADARRLRYAPRTREGRGTSPGEFRRRPAAGRAGGCPRRGVEARRRLAGAAHRAGRLPHRPAAHRRRWCTIPRRRPSPSPSATASSPSRARPRRS